MLHANVKALSFIEPELLRIDVLHRGNRDFGPFLFSDFDLDPVTFRYDFDPYSFEMYQICENKLYTSRLSKVIV